MRKNLWDAAKWGWRGAHQPLAPAESGVAVGARAPQVPSARNGHVGITPVIAEPDYPNWPVLLNYRQRDEPYCVGAMHDFLVERFGPDRIFRDTRSLRPGEDYTKLIMNVVRRARVVVVVIGSQWLTLTGDGPTPLLQNPRDWVRREIDEALRLRKHVVPVLLEGVEMPCPEVLPEEIADLSSITALRVSHRRLTEDFTVLADRLAELVPELVRERA